MKEINRFFELNKVFQMNTRLLILDINGVLCCKVSKDSKIGDALELLVLNAYTIIMRPGYREFLDFCYKNYTVAFFSSTTYSNASVILEKLLTHEQKSATAFCWFRDRTHSDPDYQKDSNIRIHDTIKILSDVFDDPTVNAEHKYHSRNTLLCDDSKTKNRFNNSNNVVIFEPFIGEKNDKVLYEMMDVLSQRFVNLQNLNDTVTEYRLL